MLQMYISKNLLIYFGRSRQIEADLITVRPRGNVGGMRVWLAEAIYGSSLPEPKIIFLPLDIWAELCEKSVEDAATRVERAIRTKMQRRSLGAAITLGRGDLD